uniref:Tc1-like transposase DDE domain-containing protein n=1 Tax=Paramormyrops kingsleyae TaxID=1676925 RepID=A0A3B3S0Z9_9TELE
MQLSNRTSCVITKAILYGRHYHSIKAKRRGKLTAGMLLLHDNAPDHMSRQSQLDHPPYSPDLKSLWTTVFKHPGLKVKQKILGFRSLQEKWMKCMELSGDYIEK